MHITASDDPDVADEQRDALVRVVADALHDLSNALGVARHFADHAGTSLDRGVRMADLDEVQLALQRAATVTRDLGQSVRSQGRLRSGVSAPMVVARVAERLRRAGVDEVSTAISPAGAPLVVPTTREHAMESLLCDMAGLGQPGSSVHLSVTGVRRASGDEMDEIAIAVLRDRTMPGSDRDARNLVVQAGPLGGRVSFHPDSTEWYEAVVHLPSADAAHRMPDVSSAALDDTTFADRSVRYG